MQVKINQLRDWGQRGDNESFFKRANNIERRLEKMEMLDKPGVKKELPLNFKKNKPKNITNLISILACFFNQKNIHIKEISKLESV